MPKLQNETQEKLAKVRAALNGATSETHDSLNGIAPESHNEVQNGANGAVPNGANGAVPNGAVPNGTVPSPTNEYDIPEQKTERSIDLKSAIDSVFDIANIEMRTILSPEQQIGIMSLIVYAKHYNSKAALNIAIELMMLRVSGKRKDGGSGREDMNNALKSALAPTESVETNTNKMVRKLMG